MQDRCFGLMKDYQERIVDGCWQKMFTLYNCY